MYNTLYPLFKYPFTKIKYITYENNYMCTRKYYNYYQMQLGILFQIK